MAKSARESVEKRTWAAINAELLNHYTEVINLKQELLKEVVA